MGNTTILHRADERGHANHGWLDTYHTFSFASFYDPSRLHFGVLRVLNDDVVIGGAGFGRHPHDNMEIFTVPFTGALEHADSMGHTEVIRPHDVQVMSAGTGLLHSEYNASAQEAVNFAQIWIIPDKRNVEPRYDQKSFDPTQMKNVLQLLISPDAEQGSLWLHQQLWVYRSSLDKSQTISYSPRRESNGLYLFVIEGSVNVAGEQLKRRDGIGITDATSIEIQASEDSYFLLLDVPMSL